MCSAVADAKDAGDKIPLFVHLFENRSADGVSRDETLSTIYQGALFQATRVNKSGTFSTGKLSGEVNDQPSEQKPTFRAAAASLTCVDLSI